MKRSTKSPLAMTAIAVGTVLALSLLVVVGAIAGSGSRALVVLSKLPSAVAYAIYLYLVVYNIDNLATIAPSPPRALPPWPRRTLTVREQLNVSMVPGLAPPRANNAQPGVAMDEDVVPFAFEDEDFALSYEDDNGDLPLLADDEPM
ncbi:hypothetical protein H9P43_004950 [Blastocladiella emersonii ATCC 22665]|nr:hypothetical protein H9P43_004950 [Blastocladiella emersonii ATCC 22665]